MSKAFDRVEHVRLVSVLFSIGLSGIALKWFCSYLSSRRQCVRIGDHLSESVVCSRGVPQGSVLGPLLFVMYISELSSILPAVVNHQEFADDIVIEFSHADPAVVCNMLTKAMECLSRWIQEIGLLLNSSKTQVLFLRPRGDFHDAPTSVLCDNHALQVTSVAKYLGMVIDDKLSWTHHVDHVGKKVACTTGILWRQGRALSIRARRMWYVSMILSHLCYASNCFFPSLSVSLLNRLLRFSKSGLRAVFQAPKLTSTAPLLERLGLPSLHSIFVWIDVLDL